MFRKSILIKCLIIAAEIILILTLLSGSYAENDLLNAPYPVSYALYNTTYEAILKMYVRVINLYPGDEGRHDLFNQVIFDPYQESFDTRYMTKNFTGYAVTDVNNDGTDELIIGKIGTGGTGIVEMFTMRDGKVKEIIRSGSRGGARQLEDGTFDLSVSQLPGSFEWIGKYEGTKNIEFITGLICDPTFPERNRNSTGEWFLVNKKDEKPSAENAISEEEAIEWMKGLEGRSIRFDLKSLLDFERGGRYTEKEKYEDYINSPERQWAYTFVEGKTTGGKVNVRKTPSKRGKLLKELPIGTLVVILEKDNDFYKIYFQGEEGYIREDFLRMTDENIYRELGS